MRHRQRQILKAFLLLSCFRKLPHFGFTLFQFEPAKHKGRWGFATNPDFTLTLRRASGSALTSCSQLPPADARAGQRRMNG